MKSATTTTTLIAAIATLQLSLCDAALLPTAFVSTTTSTSASAASASTSTSASGLRRLNNIASSTSHPSILSSESHRRPIDPSSSRRNTKSVLFSLRDLASTSTPLGSKSPPSVPPTVPPTVPTASPQVDNAETLPQLMNSLWKLISHASKNMQKGDSASIVFPKMATQLADRTILPQLMGHLDACKDVCDNFGVNTVLVPLAEQNVVRGFTVKSYRNPNNMAGTYSSDASEMKFAPDPFWDDDEEWDFSGIDEEEEGNGVDGNRHVSVASEIPDDDEVITDLSKTWVEKMMADLALCPFTQSSVKSGIPPGPVHYHVDRVTAMEDAYAAYWSEVCRIETAPESTISTTLHILPEFCMNSVELFEQWADTLTGTLEALSVEELLQLIFFHPQWTFRDGGDRSGAANAANYARRSPWPMVNILRTKQVRLAQKGIPTGLVYQQNEKTLGKIGATQLEKMLCQRDWSDVDGMKVNRKDMEALRVANDLQVEGVVSEKDTSFAFDSTPSANKVDRSLIDGGDMVSVIRQALEIRLGKLSKEVGEAPSILNGAQVSAAMMASDFLLEELDRVAVEKASLAEAREDHIVTGSESGRPSSAMASGGYAAAYGFDADEYDAEDLRELEDKEMAALWGGGGIPMSADED